MAGVRAVRPLEGHVTKAGLVDTCVLIAASRGQAADLPAISSLGRMSVSMISLGEFLAGVQGSADARAQRARHWLDGLLLDAEVLPCSRAVAERYAHLHQHCRTRGRMIPTNDLWIAATAAEHGLPLLTRDAHFQGLPGVEVELVA